jgi:hypothetical protein
VTQFLTSEGLNVTREPVPNITHWVRGGCRKVFFVLSIKGEESLEMVSPRSAKMSLLGLGTSVGGDVTAEVCLILFRALAFFFGYN